VAVDARRRRVVLRRPVLDVVTVAVSNVPANGPLCYDSAAGGASCLPGTCLPLGDALVLCGGLLRGLLRGPRLDGDGGKAIHVRGRVYGDVAVALGLDAVELPRDGHGVDRLAALVHSADGLEQTIASGGGEGLGVDRFTCLLDLLGVLDEVGEDTLLAVRAAALPASADRGSLGVLRDGWLVAELTGHPRRTQQKNRFSALSRNRDETGLECYQEAN
jgi:hypothetical protein